MPANMGYNGWECLRTDIIVCEITPIKLRGLDPAQERRWLRRAKYTRQNIFKESRMMPITALRVINMLLTSEKPLSLREL